MTDIIELANEPIITLHYDKDKEGNYFACMVVSGLNDEKQAVATIEYMQKLFCEKEVGIVKS
jgi:hypothetical protein